MFVRLWRFRAHAGQERPFLEAYGSDGAWAHLFQTSRGFLGTELLRSDVDGWYLTVDRWTDRAAWLSFRQQSGAAYEALDRATEVLVAEEVEIGEFSTVVPLPAERQSGS